MCGKREKDRSIKIKWIFTFGVKTEHCGRRYKFFLALLVHLSAFLGHSPNGRSDPPVRMTWWSDELMTWCLPPGIRVWIIITTSEGFFSILWLVTCLPLILNGCCCHCSGRSLKSKTSVRGFSVLPQVNKFVVALSQSVNSVNKQKLRAQLGSWCTACRNQFRVLLFLRNPFLTCCFTVLYSSTPWSTAFALFHRFPDQLWLVSAGEQCYHLHLMSMTSDWNKSRDLTVCSPFVISELINFCWRRHALGCLWTVRVYRATLSATLKNSFEVKTVLQVHLNPFRKGVVTGVWVGLMWEGEDLYPNTTGRCLAFGQYSIQMFITAPEGNKDRHTWWS